MYPYAIFFDTGLYEIFIMAGILIVFFAADRMGIKSGFSVTLQRILIVSFLLAIVFGFFGAVLFQAFYNYLDTGVFKIDSGTGMTFYGGLIFGAGTFIVSWFVGGKLFCKDGEAVKKFGAIADIAACLIPLAHAFGRIGCFFAGCCHGKPTDAWYGVTMHTEYGLQKVVPVQLFESAFLFLLAGVLFFLFFKKNAKDGASAKLEKIPLLSGYAFFYGIWRFFIEYARGDDRGSSGIPFLSPSQLTAIVLIVLGIVYFCAVFFRRKKKNKENTEIREN